MSITTLVDKKQVFVGMSGGVDSSVTAALLKRAYLDSRGRVRIAGDHRSEARYSCTGFDVIGVHIKMWSDPEIPCNFKEDRYDAMRVCAHLGIPFETWDFTEEYKKEVVEYMIREYAAGETPNPDVMCNRHIKFGIFLKRALERGADFIATGHYVRLANVTDTRRLDADQRRRLMLMQAKDLNKDQSYFLWTLAQEQLVHCLFPIGEFTKSHVREMARKFGL
ncbi:MAG: tRNA (5-methyl aminomethyl-2-thiouridylate)-methyltransferase, partial [Parcubacteria group bacterium Gr01-1014_33]